MPETRRPLMGRRILVTGAAGYVGSHVVRLLLAQGARIARLTRGTRPLPPMAGTDDVAGDLKDAGTWAKAIVDVDVVIHLAAQISHRVADADPVADWQANVLPVLRLLEACPRERPIHVVLAGTVTQAGLTTDVPVDESHADDPLTIYDLHKLVAERYLKQYVRWGRVTGASLRLPNLYGPGPTSTSADRGVLNAVLRKALGGQPVRIYGSGGHLRDYLYVEDAARAFVAAAAHPAEVSGHHFVLGTGRGVTVADAFRLAAQRVSQHLARPVPVEHVEPPEPFHPIEARDFVAQPRRFQDATGWRAQITLEEGIDRTIQQMTTEVSA